MYRGDSQPTVWTRQPHTKAKHDILERYLGAWFGIFGHSRYDQRVVVLDGFAGPGRYDDGEAGSPILALNTLLDHNAFNNFNDTEFMFLFNEYDSNRFSHLQNEISAIKERRAPWPGNVHVETRNENFQDLTRGILDAIPDGRQLAPTFAFVDPFGYRDVPMALIRELVESPKIELFIYFDFNSVNRFAKAGVVDEHFNALFHSDEYRNAPDGPGRGEFLHDLYETQLREVCDFAHIGSFKMIHKNGHTGSYLFFCTRNDQAFDKMKQAMWALAPGGDYRFDDRLAGQPVLFENEANTGPLKDELQQHFGGRTVPVEDVIRYVVASTPFHSAQVKRKTLKPMQDEGRITSPNQSRRGAFKAGTLITFQSAPV